MASGGNMSATMLREIGSETSAMVHSRIPLRRRDQLQPPTSQAVELAPLHFALSLAIMLPPHAIIAPRGPVEPVVRADPPAVRGAEAIEGVLGRPTTAVGSGHVFLDEVDRRLTGLVARLNAYRVTATPTALVCTGLVIAADTPSVGLRATARELWELATETLDRRGQICQPVAGLGDDALLVLHGGCTAQVAWLTAGRLATVSVTSRQDDTAWAIASATTIARLAVERRDQGHLGCRGASFDEQI
jgi:hypothetical protein